MFQALIVRKILHINFIALAFTGKKVSFQVNSILLHVIT